VITEQYVRRQPYIRFGPGVAHGLGGGIQQVLRDPVDLLIVLGLTVVSAVFHECGHAVG
jgi:hypothetical protein